ncbi:AP3-complex subunit beta-A isoform X1 [Mercurialis annua]|uniref:AP3-complex subunit beta-A isoform X1 n=1 Tax=Mercurialis annua TaxID=3986 RepID=UPI00215F5926|nr:AP3-complex subunit beta-A isoform X1 [Mercurialis annua]
MFPQFGATAETLSKASTIMFRIGTDAHLYDDPEDVSIAPLLDSKYDSEKCEALKRLLALIAQGFDVSNFFPLVVKNVASQSLEVKKLVYLYLLHYAEKRPNEALLSINSFQKDLGDINPLVRAWALRTMAGIRLHVIASIVLVAVGKCARDPSVYVRKCAANALPKLHDLHIEEHSSTIEEIVGVLLSDSSPGVVGAAAAAFTSVCPNNYSLIGKNYRRLCEVLPDVEDWGQIVLIGILLRYAIARHGLVKESLMFFLHTMESSQSEKDGSDVEYSLEKENGAASWKYDSELASMVSRCYIEGSNEYLARTSYADRTSYEFHSAKFTSVRSNDDVKMLLQCTSPLLWSNNSAVVLAAAGVHWIMAPFEDVKKVVKPVLFLLRSSTTSKYVVLCNIQVFTKAAPSLFAPYFEDFFVLSSDSYQNKALKLEILCSITTESSMPFIFKEFQDYVRDPDRRFAADTIAAIGLCAQRLPQVANTCLEGLLALTRQELAVELLTGDFGSTNEEAGVLVQAITSIKSIIKQDPPSHEKVVIQLVRSLDSIKVPAARAIIVWMMGEYSSLGNIMSKMITTVLKYLAWSFSSEALETKLQILTTTVKVLADAKEDDFQTLKKVWTYVLELAELDLKYDVRDRARLLKKLVSSKLGSQETKENTNQREDVLHVLADCIFREQTMQSALEPINYRIYLPGSLSQIVLHAAPGYEPLPKPCSILHDELSKLSNTLHEADMLGEGTNSSGTLSESSSQGTASDYSSERSIIGSSGDGTGDENGSTSGSENNADPLIQVSDVGDGHIIQSGVPQSASTDLGELMSKRSLESWLDEQPTLSNPSTSEKSPVHRSSARISIRDIGSRVKPKSYNLLDPANGNGLKVDYSFSSEISTISHELVCLEVSFENCSTETISKIMLVDEESNQASDSTESSLNSHNDVPILVSMEEITSLEPGQTIKRILHVRFHHHLLPFKLVLYCNDKKVPVKLRPDIGYFVKPCPMNIEAFTDTESRLPGMFEYIRSCAFTDHIQELNKDKGNMITRDKILLVCESLAVKTLSNANFSLVSVDMPISVNLDDASGLCLRFSSELLSNSMPCLITLTAEGKCTEPLTVCIKVNCEETVFGLNLLNRIVNFLN